MSAYRTWVSEIMLQQTRVAAVLPYFQRFMARYPTVQDLARGDEEELLKLWEGLGYYSRARNLQKAARIVAEDYAGAFPADYKELIALPGIGDYTAGAILSIAFGLPVPAVDGNVLRIASRITGWDRDVQSTKKEITRWMTEVVPSDRPGAFNQAPYGPGLGPVPACHPPLPRLPSPGSLYR
ncbi:MAG: A/G-specific adenine glycosylase [Oscillospiraceae bacterium]